LPYRQTWVEMKKKSKRKIENCIAEREVCLTSS
jgi:hypothetical protein